MDLLQTDVSWVSPCRRPARADVVTV